jgi:pyruvate dehydrogenase E2 component (dihydrolipoamide acetyltransferase)
MRIAIEMPNLGYDMERGTIAAWTKQVGDRVTRGEPIADIETDKATIEMEALANGTLVEIVHPAGTELSVGEVMGFIDDEA